VIDGEGTLESAGALSGDAPEAYGEGSLLLYGPGDHVTASADKRPVRFLLVAGKPFHEPIAWYGPVVMNTQDELKAAFEEFERGTFVKHAQQ